MDDARFESVFFQSRIKDSRMCPAGLEIVRDNETGVQYLVRESSHGYTMTVLVDRDGKPLLDK